jgi:signal transduction histidine kinase
MPRLSQFIADHNQEILDAWAAFAKDLPTTVPLDIAVLRDHAQAVLNAIVADLKTPETDDERDRKARGVIDSSNDRPSTAASQHGLARAERGFSVESMVAEFRALRASVISLWVKHQHDAGAPELEEMRRFNEAIDQAIAEALARYTREVENARDRFLAVLGHDLRTPLSAILTSSRFLLEEGELSEMQQTLIAGLEKSGRRMSQLIDDLLDLALTHLGESIPVNRTAMDLGVLVHEVVNEVGASAPAIHIETETNGALTGDWDATRLGQALTNLLSNAIQHGAHKMPIRVAARGDDGESVSLAVTNAGPRCN